MNKITDIINRNKKLSVVYLLIFFVMLFAVYQYYIFKKPVESSPNSVVTISTDKPDESKKNADEYNWQGAPEDPKKIVIEKLNVDSYVQKMGVDQNMQIAVPSNIHLAGWFVDSVQPGKNGLSIIAGHVSGPTQDGVFKQLNQLEKGDSFKVELGNGKILNYKVIDNTDVKVEDSANILFSQDPNVKSQVNLITCGGEFDKSQDQYQNRIIVSGELQ